MLKIGIDIRLIGKKRTGDEAVVFNLVKNLAKIDTQHQFELFTDVADSGLLSEIAMMLEISENKNFKIISLKTQNRFSWNFWTLPRYLRKNPVDVYHTQYITPFFVPKRIKILTIVHDISFNFFGHLIKFSDLFFLKVLLPLSLKRADKIVGVSEFTKNEIIKYYGINEEKVAWIYNAIGEEFLSETISREQMMRVRDEYGLPKKFILYLGTLQPRKNIPHLILAFSRIKDRIDGIKLVICGSLEGRNSDKEKILESINNLGISNDVILPGFIEDEDKVAIFAQSHAFVFPSLYEGFGIPPLESMSQEVPVLCSDIASLKEVASDGALFFEVGNLDDFSKKLYDICMNSDLRSELIRLGKQRVGFFSWEKSTSKILAIYEEMMHN